MTARHNLKLQLSYFSLMFNVNKDDFFAGSSFRAIDCENWSIHFGTFDPLADLLFSKYFLYIFKLMRTNTLSLCNIKMGLKLAIYTF